MTGDGLLPQAIIANALADLVRATKAVHSTWSLVGGEALIAHGVPRETLDADVFAEAELLEDLAAELLDVYGWTALEYDVRAGAYVPAEDLVVHHMDDPVLFDIGQERRMIPLLSSLGLLVELLAAQHPIEQDMIECAGIRVHHGVRIPVAPLGGILLVKTKADRLKDRAAIEQVTEHLGNEQIREALNWAQARDPATTEDLRALIQTVRTRQTPKRKTGRKRKTRGPI
jgi:hypothetical protein